MWRHIALVMAATIACYACNNGLAAEEAPAPTTTPTTVVTSMNDDVLLKKARLKPDLVEVSEDGWVATNLKAKTGETFQLVVAVCSSTADAGAIYDRRMQLLSVPPRSPFGELKIGERRAIGQTWAFFVRDNVFLSISWKNSFNAQMVEQIDRLISTKSTLVKRAHFVETPQLKDIPKEVVIAAGGTKDVPLAWVGMGERQPKLHVTSPDPMANQVVDATARLKVHAASQPGHYPVTVCAVGEGLVLVTTTINVVVQPAATQPATSQAATMPVDTAPTPQSGEPASPTNPKG